MKVPPWRTVSNEILMGAGGAAGGGGGGGGGRGGGGRRGVVNSVKNILLFGPCEGLLIHLITGNR